MINNINVSKKRIRFIINPISGTRDKYYLESFFINYINHRNISYDIVYTEYGGHGCILAKEAVDKNYDAVVAIGGDGTINDVAQGLINTDTALGIIPNGSGNGLGRCLRIPLSIKRAIDIINTFHAVDIDTARINGLFFVSIAGVGFDAQVAEDFAQSKTRGFFAYFSIIVNKYFKYKPKTYRLTYDGKTHEKKAMMISFANSNQYGFNTIIAPQAKVNDGLIDVCIIEKIPLIEAPFMSLLLFLRRIDASKNIEIIKTSEIKITQNKKRIGHVDGDAVLFDKEIEVKVFPKSLKVLVSPKLNL